MGNLCHHLTHLDVNLMSSFKAFRRTIKDGFLRAQFRNTCSFKVKSNETACSMKILVYIMLKINHNFPELEVASFVPPTVQNAKTLHLLTKKSGKSSHLRSWYQQLFYIFTMIGMLPGDKTVLNRCISSPGTKHSCLLHSTAKKNFKQMSQKSACCGSSLNVRDIVHLKLPGFEFRKV